jgi:predicted flap endonuclease-1-like 5' DNA nuclease
MTSRFDHEIDALQRARDRLAARVSTPGLLLPAVIGPHDFQDAARRAALAKIEEALLLLRDVETENFQGRNTSPRTDAFRTVLKVKSTTSLSSMIPTLQPVDARDDLTEIRGINEQLSRRLAALGVTRFRQIADWRTDEIGQVVSSLGLDSEIINDRWVEQAKVLAAAGPKTTRLEPVVPVSLHSNTPFNDVDLKVGHVGLNDILTAIRSSPASIAANVNEQAPSQLTPMAVGSLSPLPVAPHPSDYGFSPAPSASTAQSVGAHEFAPEVVPLHVDASARLTELERELKILGATYAAPIQHSDVDRIFAADAPTHNSTKTTFPKDVSGSGRDEQSSASRELIVPPSLQDRLGGMTLQSTAHSKNIGSLSNTEADADLEEADVMIITKHPKRADLPPPTAKFEPSLSYVDHLTREPPTARSPSTALVPASQPPLQFMPTEEVESGADVDDDEATVVIVHQPKAAQMLSHLAFFQAANQPPEERAVQRFLKTLSGDRT